MKKSAFILASASPRRRELLEALGAVFEICPADIPEILVPGEPPLAQVRRLAWEKARHTAGKFPGRAVLAADTIVVLEDQILGKPADLAEAGRMLRLLSGRGHQVMTAFCLLGGPLSEPCRQEAVSEVFFRSLAEEEIEAYLKTGESLDKAGAYAVQGLGVALIREVRGSLTNVVGLPLEEVRPVLEKYLS
jgi:septum formation protein